MMERIQDTIIWFILPVAVVFISATIADWIIMERYKPTQASTISCSKCIDQEGAQPIAVTGPALLQFNGHLEAQTKPVLRYCHSCGVWFSLPEDLPEVKEIEPKRVDAPDAG